MDFVHLHVHSDNSLLDGACKVGSLVEKAKSLGMRALALTDHGNMFGAIEFYQTCMKQGIKPILGIEAYIAPGDRHEKTRIGTEEPTSHLTLLVRNEKGYRNLCKLSSLSYKEGFYYKPRMDKELLRRYSDGLIALSGCPKSEFAKAIKEKEEGRASKIIRDWMDIFGKENVFIEIQEHGLEDEKQIQHYGSKIAKELGIDLVATNDVHYIEKSHYKSHDVLLAINTGSTVSDGNRLKYEAPEFYLKSPKQMYLHSEIFKSMHIEPEFYLKSPKQMYSTFTPQFHKALENTLKVAERCNLALSFDDIHMPVFNTGGRGIEELLKEMCYKALKEKYKDNYVEARERLEYELSVINSKKFASYFLIVQDIVNYAKKNNIQVGPGRGSAAGCIVSYLLGITDLDPIEYKLLFERFLNPERKELPDIDLDFEPAGRSRIIHYLKSKYGEDNVAQIITFSVMKSRLVIRDVSRALNIELRTADELAKRIPRSQIIDVTISSVLENDAEFKNLVKRDKTVGELIKISLELEGLKRHLSKHAAGIVVTDRPVMEYCPLYYKDGEEITQYDMNSVQKLGLLKIDVLGVETLAIIRNTISLINKRRKLKLSVTNIPLDDSKTFELLSKGLVKGVFQLEVSKAARDLIINIQPARIQDVMTAMALNRPGPMQTGMVDLYADGKRGALPSNKIKQLDEILEDTYGALIYQEQVMMIANKVAGFTLAEADKLRKAMGKKIPELMEEYREKFVKGAVKNGINKKDAAYLYEEIKKFAGYAFNKSHACAYGLISYYTAYLKANYPLEFMSVIMSHNLDDHDKLFEYLIEARSMGIKVLPPDINKSNYEVTIEGGALRLGMGCIRHVGENVAHEIVTTRKLKKDDGFKGFIDFCETIDLKCIDKRTVEYLIKTGAFDSVGEDRSFLLNNYEQILKFSDKKRQRDQSGQLQIFGGNNVEIDYPNLDRTSSLSKDVLLAFEKEALGFYLGESPLDKYRELIMLSPTTTIGDLSENASNKSVVVCGLITRTQMKVIHSGPRRGSHYALLKLNDLSGGIEVVCFQNTLEKYASELKEDKVVVIDGRCDFRGEKPSLIARSVMNIENVIPSDWVLKVRVKAEESAKIDRFKGLLCPDENGLPVSMDVVDNDKVVSLELGNNFRLGVSGGKNGDSNNTLIRMKEIFPDIKIVKTNRKSAYDRARTMPNFG